MHHFQAGNIKEREKSGSGTEERTAQGGGICKRVNRGDYNIIFGDSKDVVESVWNGMKDEGITPPEITEDYLEINEYSRPGTELKQVKSIFVHYTANKGTSAAQNRSYFSNLPLTRERSASAHLIIGYDGEIVQCIPFDEQAFAVITRNDDSISIECCYLSDDGSFTRRLMTRWYIHWRG